MRSSDARFVKTSGLRWMSLMLLAPIPWAGRVWALPPLAALVPSERCCRGQGRRHKTLIDVGRQMALQTRRWLPDRDLVLVADSGFSALLFLDAMRRGGVAAITRPAPDAALYEPAPPRLAWARSAARARRARACPPCATSSPPRAPSGGARGWWAGHGAGARRIEIASATAVWRHGGLPVVPPLGC